MLVTAAVVNSRRAVLIKDIKENALQSATGLLRRTNHKRTVTESRVSPTPQP